eukprot:COSAG05_NODE_586_length_8516_cov_12.928122_3_plen_236_part_00
MWPGNINELIFKLESYDAALEESKGTVPEFVNPKYKDASKTSFKSPTRLECMMQDFPRLYSKGEKLGFTSLNRKFVRQYSPVKNNVKDAAVKQASGLEPACAAAGEMDVYKFNCDYLGCNGTGMAIGAPLEAEFLGIKVAIPPAVSVSPGFLLGVEGKVSGGSLATGSTLIIEGEGDITLKNVTVRRRPRTPTTHAARPRSLLQPPSHDNHPVPYPRRACSTMVNRVHVRRLRGA